MNKIATRATRFSNWNTGSNITKYNYNRITLSKHTMSSSSSSSSLAPSSSNLDRSSLDPWDAAQYCYFTEPRTRPGNELIDRVYSYTQLTQTGKKIEKALDLGCGNGRFIPYLLNKFPSISNLQAVDSSQNMINDCEREMKGTLGAGADGTLFANKVHFVCDSMDNFIEKTKEESIDLLFSNAALHYLKSHQSLFPLLLSKVRSQGGILAVQIPNNFQQPSHVSVDKAIQHLLKQSLIDETQLGEIEKNKAAIDLEGANFYYRLLENKCTYLDCWETNYYHPLQLVVEKNKNISSQHPVASWLLGAFLSSIISMIPKQAIPVFMEEYCRLLNEHYPVTMATNDKGQTVMKCLFPFRRVFLIAVKK